MKYIRNNPALFAMDDDETVQRLVSKVALAPRGVIKSALRYLRIPFPKRSSDAELYTLFLNHFLKESKDNIRRDLWLAVKVAALAAGFWGLRNLYQTILSPIPFHFLGLKYAAEIQHLGAWTFSAHYMFESLTKLTAEAPLMIIFLVLYILYGKHVLVSWVKNNIHTSEERAAEAIENIIVNYKRTMEMYALTREAYNKLITGCKAHTTKNECYIQPSCMWVDEKCTVRQKSILKPSKLKEHHRYNKDDEQGRPKPRHHMSPAPNNA
jgi:hypothetical protein